MQRNAELSGPLEFLNELKSTLDWIIGIEEIQRGEQGGARRRRRNSPDKHGLAVGCKNQGEGTDEWREQDVQQHVVAHGLSSLFLVFAPAAEELRRFHDSAGRRGPGPTHSSCGGRERDRGRSRES